ncbi:hypothetical protein POM88_030360 [Heracleum sosnowskyi]|uniref:Uncharacterized protein n=1 Tax=Heracleum sosnowskyi TaxID=360622 RepID=A0AAD8HVD6_9APIA|nr:hypothetical protein POM88_030360 [Heracleum sosnowskyi]
MPTGFLGLFGLLNYVIVVRFILLDSWDKVVRTILQDEKLVCRRCYVRLCVVAIKGKGFNYGNSSDRNKIKIRSEYQVCPLALLGAGGRVTEYCVVFTFLCYHCFGFWIMYVLKFDTIF